MLRFSAPSGKTVISPAADTAIRFALSGVKFPDFVSIKKAMHKFVHRFFQVFPFFFR
jgi:hypothetical protein